VEPYDVVLLGDANPDLVLTGDVVPRFGQSEALLDTADLVTGGSGGITASGIGRLGLRVALVSEVGRDVFGDFMLAALSAAGVDVNHVARSASRPTGVSVVLSRGSDRSTLTHLGTIDAEPPAWTDLEHVLPTRHVHVTSYFLQRKVAAELPRLLDLAHAAGATTSLDTNLDPSGDFHGLDELLDKVDYLLPNEAEVLGTARGLGMTVSDPEEAAAAVAALGPTTVVKLGARGAVLFRRDGAVLREPGTPVRSVDTTGAGDSFAAGFLYGLLRHGNEALALRAGVACGRLSALARGGTAGQPTRDQLEAELAGAEASRGA
jgi:ribokinase